MSEALTALIWVAVAFGGLGLLLTVAGLLGAIWQWLADGWRVEPVRDRDDDRDPWLEDGDRS